MPTYIYGCSHNHFTSEIAHSANDRVIVFCNECGEVMKRIPQLFRHYHNPSGVLLDKLDQRYRTLKSQYKGR